MTHRIDRLVLVALAALGAALPLPAFAVSASISSDVNLRQGPATSYPIVTQLRLGDTVDVTQCQNDFCQVTHGADHGWVSLDFLTRDPVKAAAPTPVTASAAPPRPAPVTSRTITVSSLPAPAPGAPSASVAAAPPRSSVTLPPAYDDNSPPPPAVAPPMVASTTPPASFALPAPDDTAAAPDVTAMPPPQVDADTGGEADADAAPGVPRPQADVPNGALTGPDDDPAFAPPRPAQSLAFGPPEVVPPTYARPGGFRLRRQLAEAEAVASGPDVACFAVADPGGRPGFCLRAGETVDDLAALGGRPLRLSDPAALHVTVCAAGDFANCAVYSADAVLQTVNGRPLGSIAVDPLD